MNDWLKDTTDEALRDAEITVKLQVMAWDGKDDTAYRLWKTLLDLIRGEQKRRRK